MRYVECDQIFRSSSLVPYIDLCSAMTRPYSIENIA